jgi:hypothetical protein
MARARHAICGVLLFLGACEEAPPAPPGAAPGSSAPGDAGGGGYGGAPWATPDAAAAPAEPFVAAETEARRLSRAEIDATLRDLVGDDTRPADRFLPEDEYAPFDNDYTKQAASQALIDSVEALATDVAARLAADPERLARLLPCAPSGPDDAACLRQFVAAFGRRALRRPLSADEVEAYVALLPFASEAVPGRETGFATAVELVVRAMLQDPEFLYRVEAGTPTARPDVRALTDAEIAARLSYLLWGTMPDEALSADADAGRLRDPTGRRAAAERMLADPRAREQLHRFHALWLGYRTMPHPPELVAALERETGHLIDRVVFDEKRSYLDLFRLRETWVDEGLAAHYGLPAPPAGGGWVPYGDDGRAGILSHGSVLSANAKGFSDSSPTQRGRFVEERLACQPIPSPPPNVRSDQPPDDGEARCKADRYAQHARDPGCAGCHQMMDPIGMGLENYDLAGRLRSHDDGRPECPIEGAGTLPGVGTFHGPGELSEKLIASGKLDACAVKQWYAFATGRAQPADGAERAEVDALVARFRAGDHALLDLILDFVADDAFALRKAPSNPGEGG